MLLGAPPSPHDREHAVRFGFGAGVDRRQQAVFEAALRLPAARGLGHDRDRRRRGGHRQPRAAARGHELLRPRRSRRAMAAGRRGRRRRGRRRARRAVGARGRCRPEARLLQRIPEGRGRHRRGLGRRLVPHRRPGARRRRGQPLLRRPQEERHPPQRREHLRGGGGKRARPASARGRGGGGRGARRGARRRGAGLHRARATRSPTRTCTRWRRRSRSTRCSSWPTTRRRATWPSSTRCR